MTAKKRTPAKKAELAVRADGPVKVSSERADGGPGTALALRAGEPMGTTYGTGANDVTITVTHTNPSFTGVITVLGTIVLPFTSGTASVTVDARTLGAIADLGFVVTIGTPAPAPPYDANLDVLVKPIVSNAASSTAVALKAALVPFGSPGEKVLVTADVSGASAPTALALKRLSSKREFYSLQLPIASLDLTFDPATSGGTIWTPVAYANGGLTESYANGKVTIGHTTDATQTESALHLWAARPFATIDVTIDAVTASVYGNTGLELRSPDGTKRITFVYKKPAGQCGGDYLVNGTSQAQFPATTVPVTGQFTLRLQIQGRSAVAWIITGGTVTYAGRLALPIDLRDPTVIAGWTVGILGRGYTDYSATISAASMYLAGSGHADFRVVSYEDGTPIQVGQTVWFLATTRGANIEDAYQGVYAYDTASGQVTATGAIFCDRGDGIWRNDNAGHLFYDRNAAKWRYFAIGHSDNPGPRFVWLSTTDVDLRFGVNVTPASQATITGDDGSTTYHEDFYPIYDASAAKWVAHASKNASVSARLEASAPLGPWAEVATAGSNETGNLIVKAGSARYGVAGTTTAAYVVRDYNTLASLGNLTLDYDTGATRVWPCLFPIKTAQGTRWHMLTFDRTSPAGSYSYGRIARYRD